MLRRYYFIPNDSLFNFQIELAGNLGKVWVTALEKSAEDHIMIG